MKRDQSRSPEARTYDRISYKCFLSLLLLLVLISNVDGQPATSQEPRRFKRVLMKREWIFRLGTDTVGYESSPYPNFGGIILNGELVYFVDPVKDRINSLSLKTGAITLGKPLCLTADSRGKQIDNIVYFAHHVIATTTGGVFVVDSTLRQCRFDEYRELRGISVHVYQTTNDSLVLCGYWEIVDTLLWKNLTYAEWITYNRKLEGSTFTYWDPTDAIVKVAEEATFRKAGGKKYYRISQAGADWLDIGSVALEIPAQYSKSVNWDNIDFDEGRLAFWQIDEGNKNYQIVILFYNHEIGH